MVARSLAIPEVLLRKKRRLPCDGQVVAKVGDVVRPADVIARAKRPTSPVVVMVGSTMGIPSKDLSPMLRRWAGEPVEKNEILAEKKGFLGIGKRVCRSPIDGVVISGPHSAGEVVLGGPEEEIELHAALPGRVVGILPGRGALIESLATYIQGIGGYGGETEGKLKLAVDGPDGEIEERLIADESADCVLAGGHIAQKALAKAVSVGVTGIVVGSISGEAYHWLLSNRPTLTVVITEGSGKLPMAPATFELLQRRSGVRALITGVPRDDAAAEVILALPGPLKAAAMPELAFTIGTKARVVSGRWAGHYGRIAALPALPMRFPSGIVAPVIMLQLDDNQTVTVARGNVALVA